MTMSLSGLAGGVSVDNLNNTSASLTVAGETSTGRLDVNEMTLTGPDAVTISTGTAAIFSRYY